jgi:hypothetical protein
MKNTITKSAQPEPTQQGRVAQSLQPSGVQNPTAQSADAHAIQKAQNTTISLQPVSGFLRPSGEQTFKGDLILATHRSFSSFTRDWIVLLAGLSVSIPVGILAAFTVGPQVAGLILAWPAYLWVRLLIKSRSTRYHIYQNRIDFVSGIISKRKKSLWLFDIRDVQYDCSAVGRITGGGMIRILAHTVVVSHPADTIDEFLIHTLPSPRKDWSTNKHMETFWDELWDAAIIKRRIMKNWFI